MLHDVLPLLVMLALLVVGFFWDRPRVQLAVGIILIAVGAAFALWGVPHLRDPVELRRRAFDYDRPQQPGLFAIGLGGASVVAGMVIVRRHTRRKVNRKR
jgi:drug/metabolite transporter (DMT)-like permease